MLLARAETKLSSSLTGLLIAAVPLVGAVIVTLTGERERLGRRRWLGLLVGIVGVAAIVGLDVGQADTLALVEVGLVAVGYAVGPIILSRSMSDLPAVRRRRRIAAPDCGRVRCRSRFSAGRRRCRPRTSSSRWSASR